ncbi:MAG: hypothetical protein JKX97_08040 [Candidatus Lindowbacteria bacterium]|nr:hypothetical protein [Candidatus Lindowbacteria bacterium]
MTRDDTARVGSSLSEKISRRSGIFHQFTIFLWEEKMWWMIPMFLVLLTTAGMVWAGATMGILLFVYTMIP